MDERINDPLAPGPIPVTPGTDRVVFAETASELNPPKPTVRDRAIDAKEKIAQRYSELSDVTRVKAREGALRARTEFDERLRTNPMQIIAASAAIGFVAGLLVRGLTTRHDRKKRFDDDHALVIE